MSYAFGFEDKEPEIDIRTEKERIRENKEMLKLEKEKEKLKLAKIKAKERVKIEKERIRKKEREKVVKAYEKRRKERIDVQEKHYTHCWVMIFSIALFFISFLFSYFGTRNTMSSSFISAVVVLFVSGLLLHVIIKLWQLFLPKSEWMMLVHGPPVTDSRTQRIIKERIEADRIEREEKKKQELSFRFNN
jgi:cation transport ATPase